MDILDYFNINNSRKRDFRIASYIESLKTKEGTNKYKMVSLSTLRYSGGKSRAVGHILEHFPKGVKETLISPFFGGGSVEFALAKKIGFKIVGYDIFDFLTNYWHYQLHHPEQLYEILKKLKPNKETYKKVRAILIYYWNKVKPKSCTSETTEDYDLNNEEKTLLDDDPLLQAAYYYFNFQLSFGPQFLGWGSSVYLDEDRYEKILHNVRSFKIKGVSVKCDSFENVINRHPDNFIFADPPYYLEGDSKMFKGLYPNPNFAIHHKGFDHTLLCELLKNHKGGFLLTYNNCAFIRERYKDYDFYFPSWHYSYGQMETRIGKNRADLEMDHTKKSHEIIIVSNPS